MRRIIRRREVVADSLRYPGEPPLAGAPLALTLAEFLKAMDAPAGDPGGYSAGDPAGDSGSAGGAVLLGPSDEVELLAPHLARLRLIVIEFPKLAEGRGYSQARLLRARYGYGGELRARGMIKRDQLYFLARCGFDAFELDPAEDPEAALAAFTEFSVATQDGSDRVVAPHQRGAVG
jgi:uncharacterized protein (DUF934 family)